MAPNYTLVDLSRTHYESPPYNRKPWGDRIQLYKANDCEQRTNLVTKAARHEDPVGGIHVQILKCRISRQDITQLSCFQLVLRMQVRMNSRDLLPYLFFLLSSHERWQRTPWLRFKKRYKRTLWTPCRSAKRNLGLKGFPPSLRVRSNTGDKS